MHLHTIKGTERQIYGIITHSASGLFLFCSKHQNYKLLWMWWSNIQDWWGGLHDTIFSWKLKTFYAFSLLHDRRVLGTVPFLVQSLSFKHALNLWKWGININIIYFITCQTLNVRQCSVRWCFHLWFHVHSYANIWPFLLLFCLSTVLLISIISSKIIFEMFFFLHLKTPLINFF